MASLKKFRQSADIEDRRDENLPLGPFGTPGLIEDNVFTKGDGTLVALNAKTDFVPQPAEPSPLSIEAGVRDLGEPSPKNTAASANTRPQGLMQNVDANDRDMIVRTVLGEAGNQGPQGQAAVASVILNRVASGKYGKTPTDVVLAPNQFEPWSTRKSELMAIKPESAAYRNVGDIVDMVASGDVPDQTKGATHFLNADVVRQRRGGTLPDWAAKPIAKIGDHTFFAPNGPVTAPPAPAATIDPLDAINQAINSEQ